MGSNLRQSGDKKLLQHYLCSFKEDIHKDEGSRVRDDACEALYNIAKGEEMEDQDVLHCRSLLEQGRPRFILPSPPRAVSQRVSSESKGSERSWRD
ncbi:hypothetical protein KSP40_PGU003463 [Platanthera guangdongensis]|uniref:Uncharacterized protein n=1 Tax=Platanthera guangdongensis TaxID=2320717 RepID=A0ABR2MIQ8_9ASPA